MRDELAQQWQPCNGVERILIDTLAQTYTAYLDWMQRLALYSGLEPENDKDSIRERGGWTRPRVTDFEAIEQAAAMADRFNRLFLRTLRALTDLHGSQPVLIRAGQVNVGGQHVNLASNVSPEGTGGS